MIQAKEKLVLAMETLLKKQNLDAITVSQIIDTASVCRKTFYRNFTDKYDLADYYFKRFFDDSFGRITSGQDFDTALLRYLEICEEKSAILRNAYASADVNGLRSYDIESTRHTYEKYLLEKGADIQSAEMRFAIEIAARGGTDMIIEWLRSGMKADKRQLLRLIKRTLPNDLLQYLDA